MFFLNKQKKSIWQKSVILVMYLAVFVFSGWLMFFDIPSYLQLFKINGNIIRQIILFCCATVYLLRIFIMLTFFLNRKLIWSETITIALLMPSILFILTFIGGNRSHSLHLLDIIGIALFLFGSFLNTYSELKRYLWKKLPGNKEKLYTTGLFAFAIHINYFGDILLFTGWALITSYLPMLLIPSLMALNFVYFIMPSLDYYLECKYKTCFRDYAQQTKRLIPFI